MDELIKVAKTYRLTAALAKRIRLVEDIFGPFCAFSFSAAFAMTPPPTRKAPDTLTGVVSKSRAV